MNETTLIYGIVLGATVFLVLRFLPTGLKARLGLKTTSCAEKSSCGSKGCDGCH
jgi:hypothetical protein